MRPFYAYVVLTRTNTLMSKMISLIKQDEFTHASITLDSDLGHMYSFGRKHTYNPLIGVFKREEINKGLFGIQKELPSRVYRIELTPSQYYKLKKTLDEFIIQGDSLKYNYMGILHCLQKKQRYYPNRFLCSEFVYHLLRDSKIINFEKPRNLVRPQDFLFAGWEVYYEGDLKRREPLITEEIPMGLRQSLYRNLTSFLDNI